MTSVATVATQLKPTVLQNSWLFPESHHEPALCNTLENSPDSSWEWSVLEEKMQLLIARINLNDAQSRGIMHRRQEGLGSVLSWLDLCHHSQQRNLECVGLLSIGALLVQNLILLSVSPHCFKSISLFLLRYFQLSGFKNALQIFNWTLLTAKEFAIPPH